MHKHLSSNRDCSWNVAMWYHHFPVRIVCGRIKNPSIWCTSQFHAEEHNTPFPAPYVLHLSFLHSNFTPYSYSIARRAISNPSVYFHDFCAV